MANRAGIKNGAGGYRSRYLSHAKRALYHLSYSPDDTGQHSIHSYQQDFLVKAEFPRKSFRGRELNPGHLRDRQIY